MASEEERAAILAEYKAASLHDDEEDDEADFDPGDDSDEDSAASDEEDPDYAILDGSVSLNEDGRLIYSGTWSMKSDPNKHSKFKLKSKEVFHTNEQLAGSGDSEECDADGPKKAMPLLFDLYRPTLSQLESKSNGSTPLPTRRAIRFDGFFILKSEELNDGASNGEHKAKHGLKVKERDLEIFIQTDSEFAPDNRSYSVTGKGHNSYGNFVLEGKYTVPKSDQFPALMELQKTYGAGGDAKDPNVTRGSKRSYDSDDDEDDEYE
jgi:hypothetical protein